MNRVQRFVRFAVLAGYMLIGYASAAGAQSICRTASAPAQLFVDSSNAVWFVDGSHQVGEVRFPCSIKHFEVGNVQPNGFAEDAGGIWFTEYLGRSVNGKWVPELGRIDDERGVQHFPLGRISRAPAHASGIAVDGMFLWIAEDNALVRYAPLTRQVKNYAARNPHAVLLGPARIGSALWFIDANALRIVPFDLTRRAFRAALPGPPVNAGGPSFSGTSLYYADWNSGQVFRFDTRTHKRRALDGVRAVSTLRAIGQCIVVEQGSKVTVYTDGAKKLRTYDENGGRALPGGLAVNNRYAYFSTFGGIVREALPHECSARSVGAS